MFITIEIGSRYCNWQRASRVGHLFAKRAVAHSEQNGYRVVLAVHDGQIDFPVTVEIGANQLQGCVSDGVVDFGGKRSVGLRQQNGNCIVVLVGHRQVQLSIPVEVGDNHRGRFVARCERCLVVHVILRSGCPER
jgi:hypothetical protein